MTAGLNDRPRLCDNCWRNERVCRSSSCSLVEAESLVNHFESLIISTLRSVWSWVKVRFTWIIAWSTFESRAPNNEEMILFLSVLLFYYFILQGVIYRKFLANN